MRILRCFPMGIFLSALFGTGCLPTPCKHRIVRGQTMGTTYTVKYIDPEGRDLAPEIQAVLDSVNASVSTYIPHSTISEFNQSPDSFLVQDSIFEKVFTDAWQIYRQTYGAFDPTVLSLIQYYGFGPPTKDSMVLDSICRFIGFSRIRRKGHMLIKQHPKVSLDFSAIAKGFGVDRVGQMLERHGIKRYLVEVGGELRALGKSCQNRYWRVGINLPSPQAKPHDIIQTLLLRNEAIATSGSYRQFRKNGQGDTITHIVDPRRCQAVITQVVSVSVIAPDCTTADALATAAMVLPIDSAIELIEQLPHVGGLWIIRTPKGFSYRMTSLFRSRLVGL